MGDSVGGRALRGVAGWDYQKLSDVAYMRSGGTPPTGNARYYGGGIPWVTIADMTARGKLIAATGRTLTCEGIENSAANLYPANTVLYAMYASIGECSIAAVELCSHQAILGIQPDARVLNYEYLYYYLCHIKRDVLTFRQQSTQPNLNKDIVQNFVIPLPGLREQAAIVSVLSDMDGEIAAMEKLLAKLGDVKTAAMQALLSGKTRLEGFSGEWRQCLLGDLVSIKKGDAITQSAVSHGNIPVIAGGVSPAYYHNQANRLGKTITISCSGAAGHVMMHYFPIFASDCSTIEEGEGYCLAFVYYALKNMQARLYGLQTGSALPHVHPRDLKPLRVLFPSLGEQRAIADVLEDMDGEIVALGRQLGKARDVKLAVMQGLLSGRVRVG